MNDSSEKVWGRFPTCPQQACVAGWKPAPHFFIVSRVARDMNDSSENVGQDGILSHEFSSFPGEFCELVNDSSEVAHSPCGRNERGRRARLRRIVAILRVRRKRHCDRRFPRSDSSVRHFDQAKISIIGPSKKPVIGGAPPKLTTTESL